MPTEPGYTACAFPQPAWKIPKAVHFSGAFYMERSQPTTLLLCCEVYRILLHLIAFMVTRSIIYDICGNCTTFFKKILFYAFCSKIFDKPMQKNQAILSENNLSSSIPAYLEFILCAPWCVLHEFERQQQGFTARGAGVIQRRD